MDLILVNKILVFIINIVGLFLAFWVYFTDRQNKPNEAFFAMTIFSILWIDCAYLSNISTQSYLVQTWARLGYGIVAIWLIFFHFFSIYFVKEGKKTPLLNKFIVVGIGLFLFLFSIFSTLLVKGVKFSAWGSFPLLGEGKFIYFGIVLIWTLFITIQLCRKYSKTSRQEKLKIQYLLIGMFIFIAMNLVFNIILPFWQGIPQYYQIGNYSAIVLLGFTAYAIVKKQLFGIRVVLAQLLVGLIAILLLVNFFISESTFEYIWKGALFVAFVVFGWLLIRSVLKEIKQREELDKLATELATTNIRLGGAYKRLEKLDMAKSEFISIASHQLRTPLAAIKGYSSMLLDGDYGALADKAAKPVQNIYQSTERLINLVNSLLNISRIEAGKIKLEPSETSIESLIVGVVNELQPQAQAKNLYVKFEEPKEPLPMAMIDQERIRNVILNLIDNALKYTSEGGVKITAEIKETFHQQPIVRITVADTGEGLSREELEKLFESFSRTGAGKKFWVDGAGLGLYIAKQFVVMHGGKIWAESPGKGHGSKFIIELPIIQ